MTTPLETRIRAMIEKDGPMPVDKFMALCLTDPEDGYYRSADPLGRQVISPPHQKYPRCSVNLSGCGFMMKPSSRGSRLKRHLWNLGPGAAH